MVKLFITHNQRLVYYPVHACQSHQSAVHRAFSITLSSFSTNLPQHFCHAIRSNNFSAMVDAPSLLLLNELLVGSNRSVVSGSWRNEAERVIGWGVCGGAFGIDNYTSSRFTHMQQHIKSILCLKHFEMSSDEFLKICPVCLTHFGCIGDLLLHQKCRIFAKHLACSLFF